MTTTLSGVTGSASGVAPHTTRPAPARVVGGLFLASTAAYLAGSALIGLRPASDATGVRLGVLLELANAVAVVGIGVLLYPSLRRHREGFALGYVAARIIESALLLVSALGVLVLLSVSPDRLPLVGDLALTVHDLAFQLAMIVLGAGSLLLCAVLYGARLVPRGLAALGFVGYTALLASGLLVIAGYDPVSLLYAPGALFELAFPVWLIIRGLDERGATMRLGGRR